MPGIDPVDAAPAVAATDTSPGTATTHEDCRARVRSTHLVFLATLVAIAGVAMLRNQSLFTTPIAEAGDQALNSLLAVRAEHGTQLVGNYSRVGFHHPGPALLYVLAASQAFFHGLLHVAPTQYNGERLGVIVFAATLTSLAVLALYRASRSLLAAGLASCMLFAFAMRHQMLGNVWFPYLYMAPFLLMVVAGGCLAAGRTVELPSFVLAVGILVHGHVSFVGVAGLTALVVLTAWWINHRGAMRAELAAHKRAWIGSAAIAGLFLLPLVTELVLHFPGPWPSYVHYLGVGHTPRTGADIVDFVAWYWLGHQAPATMSIAAVAVGAALLATARHRPRERFFFYLYSMLVLQTVLFLGYVARGVDSLDAINRYVGYFYLTVPALLLTITAIHAVVRAADSRPLTRWAAPVAVAAAVAAFVVGTVAHQPVDEFKGGPDYPAIAARLDSDPQRAGRTAELYVHSRHWKMAAGIAIAAQRRGMPWCVLDTAANLRNLFTTAFMCAPGQAGWTVDLIRPGSVPDGTTPIWANAQFAVVDRPQGPPPVPSP